MILSLSLSLIYCASVAGLLWLDHESRAPLPPDTTTSIFQSNPDRPKAWGHIIIWTPLVNTVILLVIFVMVLTEGRGR
jgi:hypothetical protein